MLSVIKHVSMIRFIFLFFPLCVLIVDGRRGGSRNYGSRTTSYRATYSRPSSSGASYGAHGSSSSSAGFGSGYYKCYGPCPPTWWEWNKRYSKSFKALTPIVRRVNELTEDTKYGTKFGRYQIYEKDKIQSKKAFGLGIGTAFIGGAGYGYGAGLASYSVYHRYLQYRQMKEYEEEKNLDSHYYTTYYERNQCLGGCPVNAHCEWSFCECDEGYAKSLGKCWGENTTTPTMDTQRLDMNPDVKKIPCNTTIDCSEKDINLVCSTPPTSTMAVGEVKMESTTVHGTCQCRHDMKWNGKAMECQILLDVDCSQFYYYSPVSEFVANAAIRAEKRKNETIAAKKEIWLELEKKERFLRCDALNCTREGGKLEYLRSWRLMECWQQGCRILPACEKGKNLPKDHDVAPEETEDMSRDESRARYEIMEKIWKKMPRDHDGPYEGPHDPTFDGSCDPMFSGYTWKMTGIATKAAILLNNPVPPKNGEEFPDYLNRTETPDESLADSLLYQDFDNLKNTTIPQKELDELFCRDIDAFSEAFTRSAYDDGKSFDCQPVPNHLCAVLYDSSDCSGGWKLDVKIGEQRRLKYWSSDWKYRNDADLVGVRYGCTFTGFAGPSFNKESMTFPAGPVSSSWTQFSASNATKIMDENIESFQCICRE